MRKYELLEAHIIVAGVPLFRIRALRDFGRVKRGERGGYLRAKENLSYKGKCWVSGNASVSGHASIFGNREFK